MFVTVWVRAPCGMMASTALIALFPLKLVVSWGLSRPVSAGILCTSTVERAERSCVEVGFVSLGPTSGQRGGRGLIQNHGESRKKVPQDVRRLEPVWRALSHPRRGHAAARPEAHAASGACAGCSVCSGAIATEHQAAAAAAASVPADVASRAWTWPRAASAAFPARTSEIIAAESPLLPGGPHLSTHSCGFEERPAAAHPHPLRARLHPFAATDRTTYRTRGRLRRRWQHRFAFPAAAPTHAHRAS